MATQLDLYNRALRHLGETKLLTLDDDRESRYKLDDIWSNGIINYALEQGLWYFGTRAAQFNPDSTVQPAYGMAQGFIKPTDWIRTSAVCSDPYYNVPITAFADEAGYWFTDTYPIYVKYISNDADYGANLGKWPETFAEYVGVEMGWRIAPSSLSEDKLQRLEKNRKMLLDDARSKAALNESAAFPPIGSWVRARFGKSYSDFDRGNQNSLYG